MTKTPHFKTPQVGSISEGTLDPVDLIEAFADTINELDETGHFSDETAAALAFIEEDVPSDPDEASAFDDELEYMLAKMMEILDELAPPYCYFGAHPGDGADYGFWPSHDAIEELDNCREQDRGMPNVGGDDYKFVNDHGNVTVYGADGSVVLELV